MKKISEKQLLINKHPQLKDMIESMWNDKSMWARTYYDDTDTLCIQWDENVVIDNTFKAMVIEMELETEIQILKEDNSLYISDGVLGGLEILKSEFNEVQKLSGEPHGIYGD